MMVVQVFPTSLCVASVNVLKNRSKVSCNYYVALYYIVASVCIAQAMVYLL